jgi:hypothetical protein
VVLNLASNTQRIINRVSENRMLRISGHTREEIIGCCEYLDMAKRK